MTDIRVVPSGPIEEWKPPTEEDWIKEAAYRKSIAPEALAKRVRRLEILSCVSTVIYIGVHIFTKWI